MGIARCVVVVDGPPQMGDGQDSAQSIHSQTGYSPGAPKAAPEAPKVAKTLCVDCEIDEKTQLSSEIGIATGHSPGLQKAAPGSSKRAKSRRVG